MRKSQQKLKKNQPTLKINEKQWWITIKIVWSILVIALFLILLIFATDNLYPLRTDSFAAQVAKVPFTTMIWPITGLILFLFFLPIWMTNSYKILMIVFSLNSICLFFQFWFITGFNPDLYWFLWLFILVFTSILVVIIFIFLNWQKWHHQQILIKVRQKINAN